MERVKEEVGEGDFNVSRRLNTSKRVLRSAPSSAEARSAGVSLSKAPRLNPVSDTSGPNGLETIDSLLI